MAGKQQSTFGQDGFPIPHSNFKGAIDAEYINPNLVPVDIVKDATNLTPFRKVGSLKQCPGHASVKLAASLPHGEGGDPFGLATYTLQDFYLFQVDKDSKEITVVIYNNGTKTRIFINPWFNPDTDCTNYTSTQTANSWITTWQEITEYYTGTIASVATSYTITINNTSGANSGYSKATGYFNGWFLVNTSMPIVAGGAVVTDRFHRKYTMVTSNTLSAGTNTLTTFSGLEGYNAGETYYLVRFPINYLYNINEQFTNGWSEFNPTITSFQSFGNELRMGCGKDDRPLILQMIDERHFMRQQGYIGAISSITITDRGSYYFRTVNGTPAEVAKGGAPTFTFSIGTGATAYATMQLKGTAVTKLSGTISQSGTWVEASTTLDTMRIRPFRLAYTVATGLFTVIDAGEYTQLIPKYQIGTPDLDFPINVIEEIGTDVAPNEGTIQIGNMEIANIIVTDGGTSYTGSSTATITADPQTNQVAPATGTIVLDLTTQSIKHDGLWFDFEQPIQKLLNSQVSAFGRSATAPAVSVWYYWCGTSPNPWREVAATTVSYLKFSLKVQSSLTVTIRVETDAPAIAAYEIVNNELRFTFDSGYNINQIFQQLVNISAEWTNMIGVEVVHPASTTSLYFINSYTATVFARAAGSTMKEADGNYFTYNPFLGIDVEVPLLAELAAADTWDDIIKFNFILTAQIDRNEVILAHGAWRPGGDSKNYSGRGMYIRFGSWISRRLLGVNLYNKQIHTIKGGSGTIASVSPFESKIESSSKYPYFKYWENILHANDSNKLDVNEIPHFSSYDITEFAKQIGTSYLSPFNMNTNERDKNSYRMEKSLGRWYAYLRDDRNTQVITSPPTVLPDGRITGVTEDGIGLKFIVRTNRYIDQDITMNYTKSTFVGQTNGRRFITGCKNSVESTTEENGDLIFPNNYAVGVSQYDTFLRDASIFANVGDTDIIRNIKGHRGFLIIVKDTNTYALDVNTDDELKYRVVDTMNGRGTTFGDSLCETPYGIVMPTYDGVWLISPDGVTPLMDSTNAKLALYKSAISGNQTVNSIFYNDYNEVMIFMDSTIAGSRGGYTDVFVYNFKFKFWTNYVYSSTFVKKVRTNFSREVVMLNGFTQTSPAVYNYNLIKLSETAYQFYKYDGTLYDIAWVFQTHNMPYGTRMKEILNSWFTLFFDYTKYSAVDRCTLTVTPYEDGVAGSTLPMKIDTTLYLQTDGLWVNSTAGLTNYITITSTNGAMVDLSIITTSGDTSLTKTGVNSYTLYVKTGTTLAAIKTLLDTITQLTVTVHGTASTPVTANVTAQSATFVKQNYEDCMMDYLLTLTNPCKTLAYKLTGTGFSSINLNSIYAWIAIQNRVPHL